MAKKISWLLVFILILSIGCFAMRHSNLVGAGEKGAGNSLIEVGQNGDALTEEPTQSTLGWMTTGPALVIGLLFVLGFYISAIVIAFFFSRQISKTAELIEKEFFTTLCWGIVTLVLFGSIIFIYCFILYPWVFLFFILVFIYGLMVIADLRGKKIFAMIGLSEKAILPLLIVCLVIAGVFIVNSTIGIWIIFVVIFGAIAIPCCFGYTAAAHLFGKNILAAMHLRGMPMLIEVILGLVLIGLISIIPVFGSAVSAIVTICGLGATVVSKFGSK
ncbi:MAG: hypothetical protein WC890_06275 [Candidatus Margulisiibacteriota bacterium]